MMRDVWQKEKEEERCTITVAACGLIIDLGHVVLERKA